VKISSPPNPNAPVLEQLQKKKTVGQSQNIY
jgi:hypothetical protein